MIELFKYLAILERAKILLKTNPNALLEYLDYEIETLKTEIDDMEKDLEEQYKKETEKAFELLSKHETNNNS